MASTSSFHYEIEESEVDKSQDLDSRGNKLTTVKCHGQLVAETRGQLEEIFKVHPFQGRIVIDLADVSYVDSAGLGALIRLKLSAVKHGAVSVEYVQMTPRIMQLLKLSHLTEWFSS
jgi:anti-anti-sigma factor